MTALPYFSIPVTVQTAQVAPAMAKVEKTISESAQRIGKIRGALTPSLGILGGGAFGGLLGGAAQLGGGLGGAAVGAGLIAAPFLAISKFSDMLQAQVKGATQAIDEFNKTGAQQFASNSIIAQRLANIERSFSDSGGFMRGFVGAAATGNEQPFGQYAQEYWSSALTQTGAFIGAFIGSGSFRSAISEAALSVASEPIAKQVLAEQRMRSRMIASGELSDPNRQWSNPLSHGIVGELADYMARLVIETRAANMQDR